MPPSIRLPPARASSSALLSFLVGPSSRTTTTSSQAASYQLTFQRRRISQTLPRRQHNAIDIDQIQTPPPNTSLSTSAAGTGVDYSSPPLSSFPSSSQQQHHQIPPPPPSPQSRGFLSQILHLIRSHPLTLSLSRRLLALDQILGSPYNRFISHPWRVLIATLKFLAFAHLFLEHVLSMAPASGPSMLPTFEVVGEWLVVSRFHKYGNSVKVGDLVVYQIPISTSGELGVKRIMGLPGDYVLVDTPMAGGGTVEGEVLGERPGGMGDDVMIQVPEGHCWVVGDNLTASRDSRTFGPVPLALIRGKVFAKIQSNWLPKLIRNPLERVELEEALI